MRQRLDDRHYDSSEPDALPFAIVVGGRGAAGGGATFPGFAKWSMPRAMLQWLRAWRGGAETATGSASSSRPSQVATQARGAICRDRLSMLLHEIDRVVRVATGAPHRARYRLRVVAIRALESAVYAERNGKARVVVRWDLADGIGRHRDGRTELNGWRPRDRAMAKATIVGQW